MHSSIDPEDAPLELALRGGDETVIGQLFEHHRPRLTRMVQFRLDPRLAGRIDPEDVVQETFLEAEKRLDAYRNDDKPFLVWIRLITQQTMIDLHRKHLGAKMRTAGKEVSAPQSGIARRTCNGTSACVSMITRTTRGRVGRGTAAMQRQTGSRAALSPKPSM